MSQGPRGMLAVAIAMATGAALSLNAQDSFQSQQIGQHLLSQLKYHYHKAGGRRPSGAAAAKRAKMKRRNIGKHPRTAHKYGGNRWNHKNHA